MKTRPIRITGWLILWLSLCQISQLPAQGTLGVDISGGSTALASGNGGLTVGWEFQVTAPQGIVLNGLGFWDDQANGFAGQTFDVGIWNASTDSLLRESVITSTSTLVSSLNTTGGWRVNTVTPVTLAPGDYVIGALMPVVGANGIIFSGATINSGPGISFLASLRQLGSSTLAMPNTGEPAPGFQNFGPTFTYAPVPEADSLWLSLMGLGALSIFARLRRREVIPTR